MLSTLARSIIELVSVDQVALIPRHIGDNLIAASFRGNLRVRGEGGASRITLRATIQLVSLTIHNPGNGSFAG